MLGVPDATPTRASLWRVALGADKLTPVSQPTLWLNDAAAGVIYRRGRFKPPTTGCEDSATEICLNRERFKVELFRKTPSGQPGGGQQRRLTSDTGYFWFFSEDNVEIVVKVLDACSSTDRFWVFAGRLTNVQVEMRVEDTVGGSVKAYRNPINTPIQPMQDTAAFSTAREGSHVLTTVYSFDPDDFVRPFVQAGRSICRVAATFRHCCTMSRVRLLEE